MKNQQNQTYKKYVEARAKKSSLGINFLFAFLIGGLICVFAQGLLNLYTHIGLAEETAKAGVIITLIFITALLTGLGLFSKIAKRAGAGTFVPITGFANAIAAPAIDSKAEGWILGLGAKIFVIAGPVILYGTLASVVYGVIYYIVKLIGG
ncbi:MAG: SpoVA/SpoVAEb family sporulation membrane protein [Oscillospiraceae bacterium]|nr:SpoVA/SpoVAEb family sporulation membrane protein [Oscillospiraceae bacterium]